MVPLAWAWVSESSPPLGKECEFEQIHRTATWQFLSPAELTFAVILPFPVPHGETQRHAVTTAVRPAVSPSQRLEPGAAGPMGLSNGSAPRAHRTRGQGRRTESEPGRVAQANTVPGGGRLRGARWTSGW